MGNNKDKPENFFMDSFWEWIYWSAVENGWKEDETGLEACETLLLWSVEEIMVAWNG